MKFKKVGVRPEAFCGTKEDYQKKPVRALLDLLLFYDAKGNPVTEFAGKELKRIPPHILEFIVRRLALFADPKKPLSLDEAFGSRTGQQRNEILALRRNRKIWREVWFDPKRSSLIGTKTQKGKIRNPPNLSKEELANLAAKYKVSTETIRKVASRTFPGLKWDLSR